MCERPFHVSGVVDEFAKELLKGFCRGRPWKNYKSVLVKKIVDAFSTPEAVRRLEIARELMDEVARGYEEAGLCVYDIVVRTATPLLICASEGILNTALEIGLCIDPVLSIPYIPGSSIKGVVRSYLSRACGDNTNCVSKVDTLLGLTGRDAAQSSLMIFADSYPIEAEYPVVLYDIITPHYYVGGEPVESELDAKPTPLPHVSIPEDVSFRFVIGLYPGAFKALKELREFIGLDDVSELIMPLVMTLAAFRIEGVGARTTKGYGSMELSEIKGHPDKELVRDLMRNINSLQIRGICRP